MALPQDSKDKLVNAAFAVVWIAVAALGLRDGFDRHDVLTPAIGLCSVALWERRRRRQRHRPEVEASEGSRG